MVGIGKGERSEAEIRERFLQHTSEYQGSDAIHADGSKSENDVVIAAVRRTKIVVDSLLLAASILIADLDVILAAVIMTRDRRNHPMVVY